MIQKNQNRDAAIAVIRQAGEKCKSTFICRGKIGDFTGGAISAGYIANLDSIGKGPEGAFKAGRRQCYPVESLVNWLISRLEVTK